MRRRGRVRTVPAGSTAPTVPRGPIGPVVLPGRLLRIGVGRGRTHVRLGPPCAHLVRILDRLVHPGLRLFDVAIPVPPAAAMVLLVCGQADRLAVPGVPDPADGRREVVLREDVHG